MPHKSLSSRVMKLEIGDAGDGPVTLEEALDRLESGTDADPDFLRRLSNSALGRFLDSVENSIVEGSQL